MMRFASPQGVHMATSHPRITVSLPLPLLRQLEEVSRMLRRSRSSTVQLMVESSVGPLLSLKSAVDKSSPGTLAREVARVLHDQAAAAVTEVDMLANALAAQPRKGRGGGRG